MFEYFPELKMGRFLIVLVAAAIFLANDANAWLTGYGFRELIIALQRTPNQSVIDVQEPLRMSLTKEEALKQLMARLNSSSLRNRGINNRQEESSSTTVDPDNTTAKFDDPNFIPGEYLDPSGEAKFITPAPITDILIDFMAEIEKRQDTLWQVGVYILLNWMLQGAFIILSAWVLGLFVPMYTITQKMGETLPMEDEDRVDKMMELALMYEQNPLRFAHLPGFEIPGFDPH